MARKRRKIGEILKEWRLITDAQFDDALKIAQAQNRRVGEVLIELGYVAETDVAKALASQFEMEYIDLEQPDAINKDNLKLLPDDLIKKYLVLPVEQKNGRIKVLIHDPMDLDTLDTLRFRLNTELDTALGARGKIKEYIDRMFSETRGEISQITRDMSIDVEAVEGEEAEAGEAADAAAAPIVRLVNQIIDEAVNSRASDIHIEPFASHVRLRYRIDGVCQARDALPKRTQSAVIARLKIMSGMRVEEKRVPQDGRIKKKVTGEVIDFRVACCPTYHGESIVARILRPESARVGLQRLGMQADTLDIFNRLIRRPNGIFLVTGPTGSGKTTTLYTALDVLNRPDKKIITAEDPVEYMIKGINQCQINEAVGLTFDKILRAMLRQAPNIVLVGEIRDKEVGDVAIQAALTGHLVFSTLHTNDAPSALTRLIDMGIKPFLVASSIQAVLAQRLVRILCPHCKAPDDSPDHRMMSLLGFSAADLEGRTIYKAVGCSKCNKTGYRGRQGIYELMIMNSELRDLAFKRAPLVQMRQAAMATGMRNLLGDGKLKILEGATTMDEVSRITQVAGVVDTEAEEPTAAA
ncbi:MAG: ATPase, T2SS/T4P/T4SS family [Phycisphaeraceae bacterium]